MDNEEYEVEKILDKRENDIPNEETNNLLESQNI